MVLSAGVRLGPSGIPSAVGAGNGEIYKARKLRLEQMIAITGRVLDVGQGMNREIPADRWRQISQIYHAALAHEGDRAAFLEQASAGDETLRREVESLLAISASAEAFHLRPQWPRNS